MKNVVLIVGALALLALGGWFVFGEGGAAASDLAPALEQPAEPEAEPPVAGELPTQETNAPLAAGAAPSERTELDVAAPAGAATEGAAGAPSRLRVRVLDADGATRADVEVQVAERSGTRIDVKQRATTDQDGLATFEEVDLSGDGRITFSGTATLVARVDVLAAEAVEARLDEALLARDEPVELRLPPTGSVVVRVLDADHGPAFGNVSVRLTHVPEGEAREVSPFGRRDRTSIRVEAEAGVARFPLVACGIDVHAVVTRDINNVACRAFGPGPLRSGDEATLEARFGDGHPVVQLRVLDESGVPLGGSSVSVTIVGTGGFLPIEHEFFPRTDPEGRLRVDLEREPDEDVVRHLVLKGPRSGEGAERPSAIVALPEDLPNGLNELGDVTLGAAPLFVEGRVVDDAGRPLAGLELRLERQENADQGWWDNDSDFDARSDADGRFEVRGTRPGSAFRVTAISSEHASRWTEFEPGDRGVLVELTQAGGLEGRLLLDPGVDPTDFQLFLQGGPDDEFVDGRSEMATPAADGSFSFGGLLTGADRTLVVRTQMVWSELAAVEGLDVVAGQVLRDPRLDPFDLRGKLFAHELVVVGGEDAGALSGQIQFGPVGAERLTYDGYMSGRKMTIATPFERFDLHAKFRGFRTVELSGVSGRVELPLRESLEVTLVLLGGAELPKPPIYVKLGLVPVGGGHSDIDLSGDPLDERREVRTKAPGVGRMEVHWILERRMSNGGFATSFAPPEPIHVEVLEGVENQRFEVSVTQEELDEIVSRLP